MAYANPGLRPGLSSAVPTGLNIEMVILTQAFSPGGGASNSVRRDADDQANVRVVVFVVLCVANAVIHKLACHISKGR